MAEKRQKLIGLTSITSKTGGFTLLELIIVLGIIGALMLLVPNLRQRTPRYEREQFIARLNALTKIASLQALTTRRISEIEFDFAAHAVQIRRATGAFDEKGLLVTHPIRPKRAHTFLTWPEAIEIKQFIIEGTDEMARYTKGTGAAFFYVMPEGVAQQVTINFIDKKDTVDGKVRRIGLVLNPFTMQFNEYDEFQK
jgi:prepilin-type N-terminal cleavage/methylation domain-containing protein